MSKYEKIASYIIGVLIIIIIIFSYSEITEIKRKSDFDRSFGEEFIIGDFTKIIDEEVSAEMEKSCVNEQLEIASALHDLADHLSEEKEGRIFGKDDQMNFEVNSHVLELFCHVTAKIILEDSQHRQLIIEKNPFTRGIPEGRGEEDEGTGVHLDATIVEPGEAKPGMPTTSAEIIIPDRFFDEDDDL